MNPLLDPSPFLAFEDPNSGHHKMIPVWIGRRWINVSYRKFVYWFPALEEKIIIDGWWLDTVEIGDLIVSLVHEYGVPRAAVHSNLRTLFGHFRKSDFRGDRIHRDIAKTSQAMLDQDLLKTSTRFDRGLFRSRTRFITLAFLAQSCISTELALILVDFFRKHSWEIIKLERSHQLIGWVVAVSKLRGLVKDYYIDECLHALSSRRDKMFHEYRSAGSHSPTVEQLLKLLGRLAMSQSSDRGRPLLAPSHQRWPLAIKAHSVPPRVRSPRQLLPYYPHENMMLAPPMPPLIPSMDNFDMSGHYLTNGFTGGYPVEDVDERLARLEDRVENLQDQVDPSPWGTPLLMG
jgi:hypothetical protein